MKTVGNILKQARTAKELSQKEVADHLGYGSAQFISNIERGKSNLPDKGIKKFCELLGLQATEIVDLLTEQRRDELNRMVAG